jgi:hypothetical protein
MDMKIIFAAVSFSFVFFTSNQALAQSCSNTQNFKCPATLQKVCDAGLKLSADNKNGWKLSNGAGDNTLYFDKSKKQWCLQQTSSGSPPVIKCGDELKKMIGQTSPGDSGQYGDLNYGSPSGNQQLTQAQQNSDIAYKLGDDGSLLISRSVDGKFDVADEIKVTAPQADGQHINQDNQARLSFQTGPASCPGGQLHTHLAQRDMSGSAPVDGKMSGAGAACPDSKPIDLSSECLGDTNGSGSGGIGSATGSVN